MAFVCFHTYKKAGVRYHCIEQTAKEERKKPNDEYKKSKKNAKSRKLVVLPFDLPLLCTTIMIGAFEHEPIIVKAHKKKV